MIQNFNKDILIRVISFLLAVVGVYFILNATDLGDDKVFEFINNIGGSVD